MNPQAAIAPARPLTARELRRLPPADRDAVLSAAAKQAEIEYRTNIDLTAFEAFGAEDLHGESANSQAR
jgi:hypothetical protein